MIKSKEIKMVPINEITINSKNRNSHSKEQIERLVKIIKYQGFREPLVISNRSGLLLAGHGRLIAAKELGMTEVPCIYEDFDDEDQEYTYAVSTNAIASWAELDLAGINLDLPELGPFDIDLLGIKDFEVEVADKYGDKDADEVPESRPTSILLGELFQLGNHRLLCGDSTDRSHVERLMNGEKAELCFTSPPYSDQRDYAGNLKLDPEHLSNFLVAPADIFAVNLGLKREDKEVVPYWNIYINKAKSFSLKLLSWNVWDKMQAGSVGNQTAMFPIEHEWIFVFGKDTKSLNKTEECKWANLPKTTAMRNRDGSLSPTENRIVGQYKAIGTVTRHFPEKARNHGCDHPAMFPVGFPQEYIEACTNNGETVYEPFCGSGSTLIACEKTNRKCYGMEIDPQYCQVIIDRWEKFTGQKAVKL